MSRPIKITDLDKERFKIESERKFLETLEKFFESMKKERFLKKDKVEIKFESKLQDTKDSAFLTFSAKAYAKMLQLLADFDSEVAWHGVCEKRGKGEYYIEDILIFPQVVSGATVDTDDEKYATWLFGLDEGVFNKVRLHGHSHVNMSVSPSSIDSEYRDDLLKNVGDEDYYIFMIFNKKLEWSATLYDLKDNVLYEGRDIVYDVEFEDKEVLSSFEGEYLIAVTKKVYAAPLNKGKGNSDFSKTVHDELKKAYYPEKSKKTSETEKIKDALSDPFDTYKHNGFYEYDDEIYSGSYSKYMY